MVRKLACDGVASKRSITCAIRGLFQETMAYKPSFHAYNTILNSSVYTYSAVLNRASKINLGLGLGPGSGFKMRSVYNSGLHCI